jgi:hypothetical protein
LSALGGRLLHNLLMRLPDRPDVSGPGDDIPRGPEGRDAAARLAERLLRLPAGHPSGGEFPRVVPPDRHGADAESAPADVDPEEGAREEGASEEAASHLPWPDDWISHDGPPAAGDAAGDGDEPESQAGAGGQPDGGEPAVGGPAAEDSAATAAEPWASGGPYRPWFTVGDVPEPWFANKPDRPSPDPGG